jgi:aminoglycoside 3-N-acetyltransferase
MEAWEKEKLVVDHTKVPVTKSQIIQDLRRLGLRAGDTVIAHFAMGKIGWIVGGEVAVIDALMDLLTEQGTLVMPAHTHLSGGEPRLWKYPPVPESWWQIIRDENPPFRPESTPTSRLGRIPEAFRTYPRVLRSTHPQASFTAWGLHARTMTEGQKLDAPFCQDSALEKVYSLDGRVLLIGVGHLNNTILHYAEYKADLQNIPRVSRAAALLENGERVWKTWEEIDHDSEDFPEIGEAYERSIRYEPRLVGQAESRLLSARGLVDYAIDWLREHRKYV